MFEQYDAEPAFSYYPPPSSASSLALRNRPTASPFEGVSSSSSAPSPSMSSPAAWGGHEQLASSSESFSFASFSGLAEQLFNGGADDDSLDCSTQAVGEGDLASSAFALPRKESASHPMTAGLSAFSSSTTTTQTSYDSYESSSAGGDGGSWGAGSPSPFFPPVDLPSAHDAYSYGTGAVSETFYDDAFGFPSASTSYTVRPSSSSVPEIADLPEWYPDSLSSATLSTKSSFDSFAPASSPPSSANDRWDYYDFENDQPAVEGAWGFGVAPRIAEASGGSSDEEEGSGLEQWVVPNQLHLPYDKPLPSSASASSSNSTVTPADLTVGGHRQPADERDATRALLRKQASDRALARKRTPAAVGSLSLIGWSPYPPASPAPITIPQQASVARKAPPLRRKAGASSLKASFQALAFASASTPLQSTRTTALADDPPRAAPVPVSTTLSQVVPGYLYGLPPVNCSPFSPQASHSHPLAGPYQSAPSPPAAPAPATAAAPATGIVHSPMSPNYPCTPPSTHPYATSPPAAPRAIRKLPRPSTSKSTYKAPLSLSPPASSCSSSDAASPVSPRTSPAFAAKSTSSKRTKPLFGSTFINFTMADAYELLSGVAPSGNLKKPVNSRAKTGGSKPAGSGGKRKQREEESVGEERGGKRLR